MAPGPCVVMLSLAARQLLICGYLYAVIHLVESSECPAILLSHRSSSVPVVGNGSNYTLYQEFVTDGDVHNLNITWHRIPSPLDPSTDSFRVENHFIDSMTVNASLFLWNIQLTPDDGKYTVIASNDCGMSNQSVFRLHVDICEQYEKPQPQTRHNIMVVAELELPNPLKLMVKFRGASDGIFQTDWNFGDSDCLEYGKHTSKFSCNRTVMVACYFAANLWITNATYTDSDLYIVHALDDDGDKSNASTIDLRIVRQPEVKFCTNGPLTTDHNGHTQFLCQLSNYSAYVEVVVVENDHAMFNKSTNELGFGCWANMPDTSSATCTVNISTSHHSGKLHYKLCVGYNASVPHHSQLQCSDDITISITEGSSHQGLVTGLIAGASCVALIIIVLLVTFLLACREYRKRRANSTQTDNPHDPTRPLLHATDVIHSEQDAKEYEEANPRSSPTQPTSPLIKQTSPTTAVTDDSLERDFQQSIADNNGEVVPLWKCVRSGVLEREELVHIAKAIRRWCVLARYLGLSEPVIITIEENHIHDYEEQKFQMLLRWFQEQSTPPTRRRLVHIIEEDMKDAILAQDVINIVGTMTT